MKVEQGLLLNGIHMHSTGPGVHQGIIKPLLILPDSAIPALLVRDLTLPGAELTANTKILKLVIKFCFIEVFTGIHGCKLQRSGLCS
jgi:hypothetical protein